MQARKTQAAQSGCLTFPGRGRRARKCAEGRKPRIVLAKDTHIHPFLSPDGVSGFFNSDESGVLQAYMVRGW